MPLHITTLMQNTRNENITFTLAVKNNMALVFVATKIGFVG